MENTSLYHYTSSENLFRIIYNDSFRFSPFENANDIYEIESWNFYIKNLPNNSTEIKEKLLKIKDNSESLSKFIKNKCYRMSLTMDYEYKRGNENGRMWSYYGRDYKGVCIEISKDTLIDNIKKIYKEVYKGKVNYVRLKEMARSIGSVEYIKLLNESFDDISKTLLNEDRFIKNLFQKDDDWKDENEYRFIIISNDDTRGEYCIPISNAIKNVYIGYMMNEGDKKIIRKLCDDKNIVCTYTIWHNGVMFNDLEEELRNAMSDCN